MQVSDARITTCSQCGNKAYARAIRTSENTKAVMILQCGMCDRRRCGGTGAGAHYVTNPFVQTCPHCSRSLGWGPAR